MSHYTPDRWVILKLTSDAGTHYRVFATWYGGFADGDRWRMNSGITSATRDENGSWIFLGASGSAYRCPPDAYGLSLYGRSVLGAMTADQTGNIKIEQLPADLDWSTITY